MVKDEALEIISFLPPILKKELLLLPVCFLKTVCEIRISKEHPIAVKSGCETYFLTGGGNLSCRLSGNEPTVDADTLKDCFYTLCGNSVFAHEDEIREGYITLKNGSRVGIAGDIDGKTLNNINSLNIRVAHEIKGCADTLKPFADGGLLIAGPPLSGKTTVLRELVKILSDGRQKRYYRVCVVDSRNEIFPRGISGDTADVLHIKDKAKGTEIAIRTLSPEIVAFDEIGTKSELDTVRDCLNAGVSVVTTAHAKSVAELKKRTVIKELLSSGAIGTVALLSREIGTPPKIFKTEEILKIE